METQLKISLKLFAVYQETFGSAELNLKFPPQTSVGEVLEWAIAQHPQLAKWRDITRFGVNLQFVEADTLLADGDEVVLIPPVSGG
ncbi:MoaD/ThiS family protein [Merismopedia glauca]|uniref:Molybdopterin synthase sulfur carrier subunit n=2 Tax=Merismopedia TaxID=53402 RepID=A0A2T1BZZ0_9CYAN|nr:MoaD/ThiS family protein [Merismopedia glauca]PSB01589.1 molybdopterin synthase sulfur carrier subunit [Merismopedia glauca CCAP 1448/3]